MPESFSNPEDPDRQSKADLELGRAHIEEILNNLNQIFRMDEVQNEKGLLLVEDLKKIKTSLEIKDKYQAKLKTLGAVILRATKGLNRAEDKAQIAETLQEMLELFKKDQQS